MKGRLELYLKALDHFNAVPCKFLNTPKAISEVLDKRLVKKRLNKNGIPTTEMLIERVQGFQELLYFMEENRSYSVFLKPVFFSGAAGVTAFRVRPDRDGKRNGSGYMKLYTSACIKNGSLFNTKQTVILEEPLKIREFIEALLPMDVMAERWHPKDSFYAAGESMSYGLKGESRVSSPAEHPASAFNTSHDLRGESRVSSPAAHPASAFNMSYDLRVVYQFGHAAHIIVRCAKGPVTNLHLNNRAERIEKLELSENQLGEIESLCGKACRPFPGLRMAGVDVMLDRGSKKPRIIEINGQGDLIYQDIFEDNKIYMEQVKWMSGETGK